MAFPRRAGVLLPISSLPAPYGIGDLGDAAYRFADFLHDGGQTLWQVLPVSPTSYGDSPYQSPSAFAGNPYFISLDYLCRDGLLTADELPPVTVGDIDYGALYHERFTTLRKAFSRFDVKNPDFLAFCDNEKAWLDDYALYAAIKRTKYPVAYVDFPPAIRDRDETALAALREELSDDILFQQFMQYMFFTQWTALKRYANDLGISIIGDIPLYVAADSADVWANPEQFLLNGDGTPNVIAGVPPDAFSDDGQRWGNPIYNYAYMKKDGWRWWKKRIAACARLYDLLRIDHFIGIARYWTIPGDAETAVDGEWRKGPGMALINAFEEARGETELIAEDLGVVDDTVRALLKRSGYPGMKVLQFAADGSSDNPFIPYKFDPHAVVYIGTHDNSTLRGFINARSWEELHFLMEYTGAKNPHDLQDALIRTTLGTVCDTAILTMQDWLGLDDAARINAPATVGQNWRWRMQPDALNDGLSGYMRHLTYIYGRNQ